MVLYENKILAKLGYDIEVPGVWQCGLLRLSAPTEENDSYLESDSFRWKVDLVAAVALKEATTNLL